MTIDPNWLHDALMHEIVYSQDKHGDFPADPNKQLRILVGEVGELAEAIRDAEHGRAPWSAAEGEAVQVAVTALRIYDGIEEQPVFEKQNGSPKTKTDQYGTSTRVAYRSDPPPEPAVATTADWVRKHRDHEGGIQVTDSGGGAVLRSCRCGSTWNTGPDGKRRDG